MKWVILAAMLVAVPLLVEWLKNNPRQAPLLSGLIGALLFVYNPWHLMVAPLPWPVWPGYVKGIQITVLDSIALAIVIHNARRAYSIPYQWQMGAYLFAVLIAVTQSPVPMASLFYVWQLIRVYIVFRAIALVTQDDAHWRAVVAGMILGVAFQGLEAGWARAHGIVQSGGTLGHQNLLGMLTNMVLLPAVGMAMAGIRVKWAAVGVVAGAMALVFTASRASISIGAAGVAAVMVLSLLRNPSGRKMKMAGLAALALAVAAPFALGSLSSRFQGSDIKFSLDSDEVRTRMESATKLMIADHHLGVGSNYFVVAANKGKYWERAGFAMTRGNMAAHVHNSYLLVEAETGILGLVAICVLFLSAIISGIAVAFRNKRDGRGDVLVGVSVSLIAFAVHNRFEWGIVSENIQYVLAVSFGLSAGLSRSIKAAAMRAGAGRRRPVQRHPAVAGGVVHQPVT